jgi:hypothetical protein
MSGQGSGIGLSEEGHASLTRGGQGAGSATETAGPPDPTSVRRL